jgi:cytoskeleton protein RodZ
MADEVVINPTDTEVIGFAPLGEVFCSARNAKKLALKDVSNNLRLSVKQIEAIENNDFSSLPPAMITRGFIRNYARLLELDAEPLLASYRVRMPEAIPSTLSVKTSMNQVMSSNSSTSSFKYVVLVGLVLLSVAAWFYYANYMQKTIKKNVENTVALSSSEPAANPIPLPEVALPAAERQFQSESVDVQATVNAVAEIASDAKDTSTQVLPNTVVISPKVEPTSKPVDSNPPALNNLPINNSAAATQNLQLPKEAMVEFKTSKETAAQKAVLPRVASDADAKTISAGINALPELAKSGIKTDSSIGAIKSVNLAVTEQTWVRVTDKTGAVVYEKMLQPNSEDGFNGLPPFKLLIGNARATKLTFLGQQVDLTDKTKNNVARVTLE